VFLSVLYVFGFTLYSNYMASLEDWLWATPAAAGIFFAVVGAGLLTLRGARGRAQSGEAGLEYEDEGNPAVHTLGLTEQWSTTSVSPCAPPK
jgi:hypothetical protein